MKSHDPNEMICRCSGGGMSAGDKTFQGLPHLISMLERQQESALERLAKLVARAEAKARDASGDNTPPPQS